MHISLLLFLLPLTISSPTIDKETQTWTITRLDYHYMTEYPGFGPPHMPWPASAVFNTTLSFDVSIPDTDAPNGSWKAACEFNWDHAPVPEAFAECVEVGLENKTEGISMGGVYLEVDISNATSGGEAGDAVAQMPFNLKMWRYNIDSDFTLRKMFGNTTVGCDDPGSPTSYLTCMTGKPLDGMRCKLHSMNNVDLSNKKDLQIVAQRCSLEPDECPL